MKKRGMGKKEKGGRTEGLTANRSPQMTWRRYWEERGGNEKETRRNQRARRARRRNETETTTRNLLKGTSTNDQPCVAASSPERGTFPDTSRHSKCHGNLPGAVVKVGVPRGPGAVEGKGQLLVVLVLLTPHPKSLEHLFCSAHTLPSVSENKLLAA